jgi:phosphohistidine phosphatase
MSASSRTLLLWRHAKSAWDDPAPADFDRPLAQRGTAAAPRMAAWINARWQPDLTVSSPARRAVQTVQYLKALSAVPVMLEPRLFETSWPQLLEVVRETPPSVGTLLLVGHNPGLEGLTTALAGPLPRKFATAACAALAFDSAWDSLRPGEASLVAFQRPKALAKR